MRAAAVVLMLLLSANGCPPAKEPTKQSCAEDDPCWNCRTQGNRQCGPGERPGGAA